MLSLVQRSSYATASKVVLARETEIYCNDQYNFSICDFSVSYQNFVNSIADDKPRG